MRTGRPAYRTQQVLQLAARPQGVGSAELALLWNADTCHANTLLKRNEDKGQLWRAHVPGQRLRFFSSPTLRDQWLARERAMLEAQVRSLLRIQGQRVATARASLLATARASLLASLPPKPGRVLPEKPARQIQPAPVVTPQTPQPVGPGVLFNSTNAARKATAGVAGRGPGISTITPARETPASWAATPAVITPATKITVYNRKLQGDRVDLMADPLPGVPGWGSGPVIRAGALDYQRHQHHSGPRVMLAGGERMPGGRL